MQLTTLLSLALAGFASASPLYPGIGSGSGSGGFPSFPGIGGSNGGSTGGSNSGSSGSGSSASGACSSYTIISTRGTGELQGPSVGFLSMNRQVMAAVPGGKVYNTIYAAGIDQNSALGTRDIINKVKSISSADPKACIILQGYSQGAAATTNALPSITGAGFDAVRGVVMIGNPNHKPRLACNVDGNGGKTTINVSGLSAVISRGVPSNWISKIKDICIFGDGVCDTTHGFGINAPHLTYGYSNSVQSLGAKFMKSVLTQ